MATWSNIVFQDSNSPIMEQLIIFHDHTMMIIMFITLIVIYIMLNLIFSNKLNRQMLDGQLIELTWTILPALMLIFIALPSLKILYMMEEMNKPLITIKVIGHQWFWSYEYSDFKKIEFDSYMKPTTELNQNEFRLLETDNHLVVPINVEVRMLMTSFDVIHSWTIPALGVKMDSFPGRINQANLMMNRPGLYFGQCSEICGANHGFMPIVIESINLDKFFNWLINY
uniref:Cytochrome c oxidase subunit 2 n=1 Tax=Kapsa arca TaxID=3003636 RepID=A0A9E9J146_9HEMI|nr:cytochrome c oxidase subunit II [Kapsa arca]WAM61626.1 cytochrome c oxidase subunit 2 [Kapsa arca]